MTAGSVRAEFHCHTAASPDSLLNVEKLLATCRKKGIDRVAITDHNSIQGALRGKALDPERVIISEEIQTTEGEILGYFMSEEIPIDLPPLEVISRLKAQGALISIAHPFDPLRGANWQAGTLEQIAPLIDGMEVFNARCVDANYNSAALGFAEAHALMKLGGSDAHSAFELGRVVVRLPRFDSAEELRAALRQSSIEGKRSGAWVHLLSTYARMVKKLRGS